ncbi:hypothetical protein OPT61_g4120 [Boeremia exigua]|uniref:Uncharacterized protein n=1 Tax=Boeremia exigua TaxID=749465 RepID=A0ACC2IFD8_9PLEO|nr:hypothetical protein OPT61_g4120 [Boeremia exigua]
MANQLRAARDADPRVLCSDLAVIGPWFDLVQNVKAKYGILDADTYNFDETGFTMGVGNQVRVVTASERRTQPIGVQVSDNGWTTNKLSVAWLRHFIKQIKGQRPLDVGCFAPLKQAYSREIRGLALDHIGRIDKKAFIATFAKVFEQAFLKANITASFKATGLVPNDLLVVLLKLDVKVRTPTPPALGELQWNPRTPTNANEILAQSTLLRDRIQKHQGSSPTPMVEIVDQLQRGTAMLLHGQTLLAA